MSAMPPASTNSSSGVTTSGSRPEGCVWREDLDMVWTVKFLATSFPRKRESMGVSQSQRCIGFPLSRE